MSSGVPVGLQNEHPESRSVVGPGDPQHHDVTRWLRDRPDDGPGHGLDPAWGLEFVNGVEAAIERAGEIAGDKDVVIGGGASLAQQALRAGLVDELHLHVAPVILGGGRPLFGELGIWLQLERTRIRESPYATHIDFRVTK
jgi:dihydrofolate reductase